MNHSHFESIQSELHESADVINKVSEQLTPILVEVISEVTHSLKNGGKIFFCGNGGSAADAQHLATEFVCRLETNRPAMAAIALTTDTSLLTAQANDLGFDTVFSRQVEALGNPNDVLIAISTSGNSENVLQAVQSARSKKMITIAFTGKDGGKILSVVDYALTVPSMNAQRIQEAHITLGHILCGLVEQELFMKSKSE